ncbi:ubiquitin carboxyl-terminal hydrolase MINDY-2 [Petromyzon marinus]|uniref:Ubiquitin carboxyl-terminal hydrolase n=1 Tax=Petromyzon marinus TaxID=7757 RepID=A0AAJ7SN04_PETMA|nr:ubiquitin carboxyl-terminal hydrolase MINDY-2 [Petromyzon marinus]
MSEARLEGALLPLLPAGDEHPKSAGPPGEGEVPSRDQAVAGPGYREKAAPGGFAVTEATAGVAGGHRAAVDGAGGVGAREVKPDESRREVHSSGSAVAAAAVNTAEVVPSLSADAEGQAEASALRARGVGDGAAREPQRAMPSRGEYGATVTEAPGRAGAGDDAEPAKAGAAAYTGGANAAGEVGASTAVAAAPTTGTSSSSSAPGAAAIGAPAAATGEAAAVAAAAAAAAASSTSGGATGTAAPTAASPTSVSPKAAPAAAAAAATAATAPATFEDATATSAGAAGAAAGATAAHARASTQGGSARCGTLERSVMDTSSPTRSPERSANQGDPASLDAEVKPGVETNEGLDEQQQQQAAAATTTTRGDPAVGGTGGATPLHKQQQQQTTAVAAKDKYPGQSIYHIKWIKWKGESTAIITQNENGPCPLLAIMNVLLLSWKIRFPAGMEIINAEQLMECLGDFILETMPKEFSEAQRLNYEQNISDAMTIMHKLQTGLDVNVRFTGVADFEYTPECIVFDLLGLPLYHGWLVDPQNSDVVKAVGKCSYNQLVEKIISSKQSQNSEVFSEGMVAELFLDSTATQLTYHGLCELNIHVKEAEICVFFRNNHFSTIYKHKGQLFLLVTDQGFLTEESVVWESLHSVDGDGNFCDSDFNLRPPSDPANLFPAGVNQEQIDQDYLVALSLQQEQGGSELPAAESDLDLAKRLQEEENLRAAQYFQEQERQQQPQQPPQPPQQPQQRQQQQPPSPGESRSTPAAGSAERERRPRRQEDKSKCVIL